MAKQLQLRRGTTAQHSTFTGAVGEITVDTDKDVVVVHDGSTAGGFPLARADGVVATANALNTSNAYTGTSFNSITGLSSTTPVMNGTAAVGTATTAARADHVHGSDTTKVAKVTSTDNAIARYDGTGGAIQNSSVYIDDSGNLLVGTTSNSGGNKMVLSFAGANGFEIRNTAGVSLNGAIFYYGASSVGSIAINAASTSYNTSSDYRLKENIQPMQDALAKVVQLNPVTYTWKADGSDGQGFIAHELQAIVPDCVTGEKDAVDAEGKPIYQGIDTSFLVATLTKAIQELKAEVDDLKTQLEAK